MTEPIDAVLFDWGHTLFDTASSVEFIVQWAAEHGRPLARDEAFALWDAARVRSRSPEEIAKGRDRSPELHRSCWTALWSELDQRVPGLADALYAHETSADGWSPYVDAPGALQALAERSVPVVVVSDVAFDLRPILRHYGLDGFVHAFVLSGEHGTIKPERRLFSIALESVGVEPGRALMVGDNPANDGAAAEVGIRTLLLPAVPSGEPRGLGLVVDLVELSRRQGAAGVTAPPGVPR